MGGNHAMSKKADELAERVRRVLWVCHTWGLMERAAGVTDRLAFWRGKTEDEARRVLQALIAERVKRGEVRAEGFELRGA